MFTVVKRLFITICRDKEYIFLLFDIKYTDVRESFLIHNGNKKCLISSLVLFETDASFIYKKEQMLRERKYFYLISTTHIQKKERKQT